jgi:hypothetical protein
MLATTSASRLLLLLHEKTTKALNIYFSGRTMACYLPAGIPNASEMSDTASHVRIFAMFDIRSI